MSVTRNDTFKRWDCGFRHPKCFFKRFKQRMRCSIFCNSYLSGAGQQQCWVQRCTCNEGYWQLSRWNNGGTMKDRAPWILKKRKKMEQWWTKYLGSSELSASFFVTCRTRLASLQHNLIFQLYLSSPDGEFIFSSAVWLLWKFQLHILSLF